MCAHAKGGSKLKQNYILLNVNTNTDMHQTDMIVQQLLTRPEKHSVTWRIYRCRIYKYTFNGQQHGKRMTNDDNGFLINGKVNGLQLDTNHSLPVIAPTNPSLRSELEGSELLVTSTWSWFLSAKRIPLLRGPLDQKPTFLKSHFIVLWLADLQSKVTMETWVCQSLTHSKRPKY